MKELPTKLDENAQRKFRRLNSVSRLVFVALHDKNTKSFDGGKYESEFVECVGLCKITTIVAAKTTARKYSPHTMITKRDFI